MNLLVNVVFIFQYLKSPSDILLFLELIFLFAKHFVENILWKTFCGKHSVENILRKNILWKEVFFFLLIWMGWLISYIFCICQRQGKDKLRAYPFRADYVDIFLMGGNDLLYDGKTKAGAFLILAS